MKELDELIEYRKRIEEKQYISKILDWDLSINAPNGTKNYLIDVLAQASNDVFNLLTNPSDGKLIDGVYNNKEFDKLDDRVKKAILFLKERYMFLSRVPEKFNKEYTKARNISNQVWEQAKKENDFNKFLPYLKEVMNMTKEYYRYMTDEDDLYNFMVNQYSRGMDTKTIDKLFSEIKEALVPLIKKVSTDKIITVKVS